MPLSVTVPLPATVSVLPAADSVTPPESVSAVPVAVVAVRLLARITDTVTACEPVTTSIVAPVVLLSVIALPPVEPIV